MKKLLLIVLLSVVGISYSTANAAGYILFESFEGWNGKNPGWTPDGWSRDNKTGIETWTVSKAVDLFFSITKPTDGDYMAFVEWGIDLDTFTLTDPRDESFISPAFTPAADDCLFFDVNYTAYFLFYDIFMDEFNFDNPVLNIQVFVSTDNGANWNIIWDEAETAAKEGDYNEDNLSIDYEWYTRSLPLAGYAGQSIKIAIRYTDREGGDYVGLDNIAVRQGIGAGLRPFTVATNKVVHKGDRFELIYSPDYSAVSVYTISGQKLADYELPPTGTFTVSSENYSKGVYLFSFTGGKGASTVKVVK